MDASKQRTGKQRTGSSSLKVLDDSEFPVVRYRVPAAPESWDALRSGTEADIERLLSRSRPFVLISSGEHDREPTEVRKRRSLWLKQNRDRLAEVCRAMIHVEPDPEPRQRMAAQAASVSKALGLPFIVVGTDAIAALHAATRLGTDTEGAGPSRDDDRLETDIAAVFQRFQDRLLARDFDRLEALMTGDFVFVELDGRVLGRSALLERERRAAAGNPVSQVEHELVSVAGDEDQAVALVELRFRTVVGSGDDRVIYEGRGRERVTLSRVESGWKFRDVTVESQELHRDGQPAGSEIIEEMHR